MFTLYDIFKLSNGATMQDTNFLTKTTKGLALCGLFVSMSSVVSADTLTIIDGSGAEGDKTGCTYQEINVGTSGATTIQLSNFTCLGTSSSGSCSLDGVSITDGGSEIFYVNTPMSQEECGLATSSGSRTCTDGSLGGDDAFVKSQCVIAGSGSCTDADSNIINHGVTDDFYTSSIESCSTTNTVSRTCSDGVLSPASNTHITTNCDNTPPSVGVVDTGTFRDNITIGPMTDTVTGYQVSIMDRGNYATAAPSCVNGLNPNLDCGYTGYTKGARTNEVNAIRSKTLPGYTTASVKAFPLPYGGTQTTSSLYDYVLASKPGKMTSDFTGNCDLRSLSNGTISLVTQAVYDSLDYMKPFRCVIPANSLFYVNIRAVSTVCDIAASRCNSYIYPSGQQ